MKSTRGVSSKAHWQCTQQRVSRRAVRACRLAGIDGEGIYVMLAWVSCLTCSTTHVIVCVRVCICFNVNVTRVHITSGQCCHIERVNVWGGHAAITHHITLGVYMTCQSVATSVVVCKLLGIYPRIRYCIHAHPPVMWTIHGEVRGG